MNLILMKSIYFNGFVLYAKYLNYINRDYVHVQDVQEMILYIN